MHKSLAALAAAGATLLSLAPAASAADRSVTVGATNTTASWQGQAADGAQGVVPCASDGVCDARQEATLIQVEDPGTIVVTTAPGGGNTVDVDLELFTSDADGTVGDPIMDSAGASADERTSSAVREPGYYLAVVSYYTSVQGTYEGSVAFHPESVEFLEGAPRSSRLTPEQPTFGWTGGPGNGILFNCGVTALNACDDTLVRITEPGSLAVDIAPTGRNLMGYMEIYESNAAGGAVGEPLADTFGLVDPGTPEAGAPMSAVAADLDAGYYLIHVGWLVAVQDEFAGTATFTELPAE